MAKKKKDPTKVIGIQGGALVAGDHKVLIPYGALDQAYEFAMKADDDSISIRIKELEQDGNIVQDVVPDDLILHKPAIVVMACDIPEENKGKVAIIRDPNQGIETSEDDEGGAVYGLVNQLGDFKVVVEVV